MKTTLLSITAMALAGVCAVSAAEMKFRAVVGDSFDNYMSFAEEWQASDANKVKSADGQAVFSSAAKMTRRFDTPDAFRASIKVSVKNGKAGIRCKDVSATAEAGETKTLVIDCTKGGFKGKSLEVFAEGEATFDDFAVEVPVNDDASPNLVVNSGFEFDMDGVPLDGIPPYFCFRGDFNWKKYPSDLYEKQFLRRVKVDRKEKHSGNQSLKIMVNDLSAGFSVEPWRTATMAGEKAVFSLWMKSSTNGFPVMLTISENGKPKQERHEISNEWARYEIASTNMPKPGLFSPVRINFEGAIKAGWNADVWIDDMQLEFAESATEYRPSDQDKFSLGKPKAPERPASITVPKLPDGVKASIKLEDWEKYSVDAGPFYNHLRPPTHKVKAFYACDDDNLYIAFRNWGEDASLKNLEHLFADNSSICTRPSAEILFSPTPDGKHYHFMSSSNGDRFDAFNEDKKWDGTWISDSRAFDGGVEYFFAFPFKDFTSNGFTGRWTINLMRNDRGANSKQDECPCTEKSVSGGSRDKETWGVLVLPDDVASKWEKVASSQKKSEGTAAKVIGRLDFYMNEPEAKFRVWDEKGNIEEVSTDITKMACGTNDVVVKAHGREWPAKVVKLPYKKGATQVNQFTRSLIHDGAKVAMCSVCLPVKWLDMVDGRFPQLDLLAKRGFKYGHICTFGDRNCTERAARMLDQGRELGMDFILWTDDGPGSKDCSRDDIRNALRRDNIVARVVTDEPELSKKSEDVKAFMENEKKYYPYCPVMMNNTIFGFPSKFADLTTDIFMLDCYFTADTAGSVLKSNGQVEIMLGSSDTKPVWYFLPGVNDLHYRHPTYLEQMAQGWGEICAGGSGVTYFIGMPKTTGNWRGMQQFNRELLELTDRILSEELCGSAVTSVDKSILPIRTSKCGDEWWIFSVNMSNDDQNGVVITMPEDAPQNGTVEVFYENRKIELKDGKFTAGYRPLTRHIYRIRPAREEKPAKKVLMIGNSFSNSVLVDLPRLAQKNDEPLDIANLMIGGCVFSRHASNIVAYAENPEFKPYSFRRTVNGMPQKQIMANIPDALQTDKWDIVTIQQGSSESFIAESFYPWADTVVGTIRKYAPQAKILVQQTWSYNELNRCIHDPYTGGPGWFKIDRDTMFRNLTDNYYKLAQKYGFDIIPMGNAVELYRYYVESATPGEDVVGRYPKPEKGWFDLIHLNERGCRLQAYVWFRAIFGRDPRDLHGWGGCEDTVLKNVAAAAFEAKPYSIEPYPIHLDARNDAKPVKILFDTDMYDDCDDVGALAVLNALANRKECEIIAIGSSTRGTASLGMCELVNRRYGRKGIPMGVNRKGGIVREEEIDGVKKVFEDIIAEFGKDVRYKKSDKAPSAVDVYRKALADAPDNSVTVCSVGFLTNLRGLLVSEPDGISPLSGKELVEKKVYDFYLSACKFPEGRDNNAGGDAEAIDTVLREWPGVKIFVDSNLGSDIRTGVSLAAKADGNDPVAETYRRALEVAGETGKGHSARDVLTALAAVRTSGRYFSGIRGTFSVDPVTGINSWQDDPDGWHYHLTPKTPAAELVKIIDEFTSIP